MPLASTALTLIQFLKGPIGIGFLIVILVGYVVWLASIALSAANRPASEAPKAPALAAPAEDLFITDAEHQLLERLASAPDQRIDAAAEGPALQRLLQRELVKITADAVSAPGATPHCKVTPRGHRYLEQSRHDSTGLAKVEFSGTECW